MKTALYLFVLWLRYSAFGSWAGAFGWAGGVSALIVSRWGQSPLLNYLPAWLSSLVVNQNPFKTVLVGMGLALLISLVLHAIFRAPFKAWWTIRPLRLVVTSQFSQSETIQDTMQRHQVWVFVKNRSPIKSLHYTFSVLREPEKYEDRNPWQVHSGDIPPHDEHRVLLASYFLGGSHGENGKIVIFPEHNSGFSPLLTFSQEGADLCLLARAQNVPDEKIWCNVSVDQKSKKLVLKKLNVH